jgi:hypothetical protein
MLALFVSRAEAAQQPNYEIISRLAQAPGNVTVTGRAKHISISFTNRIIRSLSIARTVARALSNKELNDRLSIRTKLISLWR